MSHNRFQIVPARATFDQYATGTAETRTIYARIGKRTFDIAASLFLIVVFAPLIASIALCLLVSGGTPVFSHTRIGQGRRKFKCYKFRTMHKNSSRALRFMLRTDVIAAEEWSEAQKLTFDPRITSIGQFLRMSSLDELPQLFNVLVGDMTMVGPRPVTEKELARYGRDLPIYLSVRPGLTGLWQVHGRGTTTFEERVAMDCAYVQQLSFATDLKLMFQTVGAVLKRTGT